MPNLDRSPDDKRTTAEKSLLANISSHFPRDSLALLAILLIIVPPLLVAAYIKFFGVNMIFWDQWDFTPMLEKMYSGGITFGDLFAQHNEHRLFFPRLVMLAIAYATHYNNIYEMYASWAISIASFSIILARFRNQFKGTKYLLLAMIPISWIFFNLNQYQNILWGWQIQIYLAIFGFIAALFLLERSKNLDMALALAILCGIISSFSFINGLLVWPIGFIVVLLSKAENRIKKLALWSLASILTIGAYFYHWTKPASHPSTLYWLDHIQDSAEYLLANIGASISPIKYYSIVMGVVLSIIVLLTLVSLVRSRFIRENIFWISIATFSIASSLACMVGRAGFGVDQALSSRYITFTILGVIGTYACIYGLAKKYPDHRAHTILLGMILSIMLVSVLAGYPTGMIEGNNTMGLRNLCIDTIHNFVSAGTGDTSVLFPNTDKLLSGIATLEKYHLNIFSTGP